MLTGMLLRMKHVFVTVIFYTYGKSRCGSVCASPRFLFPYDAERSSIQEMCIYLI